MDGMKKTKAVQVGELVQSLAGHDRGDFFLVIRQEGNLVWICDGKRRKAVCCKRKNQKHIAGSGLICDWVEKQPERVNNTSVRKAIQEMLKSISGGENLCQRKMF